MWMGRGGMDARAEVTTIKVGDGGEEKHSEDREDGAQQGGRERREWGQEPVGEGGRDTGTHPAWAKAAEGMGCGVDTVKREGAVERLGEVGVDGEGHRGGGEGVDSGVEYRHGVKARTEETEEEKNRTEMRGGAGEAQREQPRALGSRPGPV